MATPIASTVPVIQPPAAAQPVANQATVSQYNPGRTSLKTSMMPGCCGLKVLYKLTCLGKTDALSVKNTEDFDGQVNRSVADEGNWNAYGKAPETVTIISTSSHYHVNDPEQKEFKRQVKFLTEKGWHELCSWKSLESGGMNYMWGSAGITLAGAEEKKETKK